MKKDAYYFSHDSNAMDDPKIVLLIDQLGMEGYGIFWALIELLRNQPDYRYPIEVALAKARQWNTTGAKINGVILNLGLFEIDKKHFFSLSLNKRMELYNAKRKKYIDAGRKGGLAKSSNAIALLEHSSTNKRKGKESKLNESKSNEIESESEKRFGVIWDLYPKKTSLMDSKMEWINLLPKDQERAIEFTEAFVNNHKTTGNFKYLPQLLNYLKKRRWEDGCLPYQAEQTGTAWDEIIKKKELIN